MNGGRRYAKEALYIGLRRSHTLERRVCLNECEMLPLEVSELGPSFYNRLIGHHQDLNTVVLVTFGVSGCRAST
jgi:hypothetical protein